MPFSYRIRQCGKICTFYAIGNRLTQSITTSGGIALTYYIYNDQNRLQKVATTYADKSTSTMNHYYDNNGNLMYSGKESTKLPTDSAIIVAGLDNNMDGMSTSYYEYDDFDQMVKAKANGKTDNYVYNGDGLRVENNISGKVARYLYEEDMDLGQVVLKKYIIHIWQQFRGAR